MLSKLRVERRPEKYLVWPNTVGGFTAVWLGDNEYRLTAGPITATAGLDRATLDLPKIHTLKRVSVEHLDANDDESGQEMWFRWEYEERGRWQIWGQNTTTADRFSFIGEDARGETRYRYTLTATAGHRIYITLQVTDRHNVRWT